MGRSPKMGTTFVTWKRKLKTLQTKAENIPNNGRLYTYEVLHAADLLELKKPLFHYLFLNLCGGKSVV